MGIDPKMAAKLKNFNKNFAKEKKRADELGGFAENPDGKYLAKVTNCDIKNSNAGEMHFVFQFEILESAEDESLVGAKASKWANVEKEDGMAYLIRDLRKFGIELEDLTQLPEAAKMIDDQKPEVKISLKTGNAGQFTYIDTVISEMDAGDHTPNDEEEGDENEDEVGDEGNESEETEETDEGTSVEIGMKVGFIWKKEKMEGIIKEILEKENKVKVSSGGKIYPVALDAISLPEVEVEEETEEEEEEVEEEEEQVPVIKKAPPKKVAPANKAAPAKKTAAKKRK